MHPPTGRFGLLREAEAAADSRDWTRVAELARQVLALDSDDSDDPEGKAFLRLALTYLGPHREPDVTPDDPASVQVDEPFREVTLFFSHPRSSWSERARFKAALRSTGLHNPRDPLSIGSDEEGAGGGFWHHWVFLLVRDSPGNLMRMERLARATAATHGVEYDGWAFADSEPVQLTPPRCD